MQGKAEAKEAQIAVSREGHGIMRPVTIGILGINAAA
jgi:hypothetical protein